MLQKDLSGLDKAKLYANRLTHISPNWLSLRLNQEDETTYIDGLHLIDSRWIQNIRTINPNLKIMPRIVLDNWLHSQLVILLTVNRLPGLIGKQLVDLAKVLISLVYVVLLFLPPLDRF